ncbi:MAG: hypothetical protein WC052_05720 [Patescibacteria group bacterium]
MTVTVLDRITADRAIARQSRDTPAYQILTQILGDYQTGATLKKPKVGDGAIIELVRLIVKANNDTIALLRTAESTFPERDFAEKLSFLENQNTILSQYIPELLTETELQTILVNLVIGGPVSIGDFQKHLRENYADRFKPGTAAQVYNAA